MSGVPGRLRVSLGLWVAGVLLGACAPPSTGPSGLPHGTLIIQTGSAQATLRVQIAETEQHRRNGLMGAEELDADAGMAFLFDSPTTAPFWMRDTLIPLSIAFWRTDGTIVAILAMQPCRADPCRQYSAGTPYVGAVEANLGYFEQNQVRVGDVVRLVR
jgi:uncharacterized protein